MSRILFICPTVRDYRELRALAYRGDCYEFHDYATSALESMVSGDAPTGIRIADPEREIERILRRFRATPLDGVASTDDYPGSALASIVARKLGLPCVSPAASLLCQHKYHSRHAQRATVPEATPAFELISTATTSAAPSPFLSLSGPASLDYPVFIKPVKSFFSVGASRVDTPATLATALRVATLPQPFFAPFEKLLRQHCRLDMAGHVLAEALLEGVQVTLEGYANGGEIHVLGVVDSLMYPGTKSFQRFEYPSRLPLPIQQRMAEVARRTMSHVGYDAGLFNIEMMYDAQSDSVAIIEINPRMSSQFADLFEKVDGFNTYSILLDLAVGRAPRPSWRNGNYAVAASWALRSFENLRALQVPTLADLASVHAVHPDARIEILTSPGRKLSQEMQDGGSYRYAVINVGGRDDADLRGCLRDCLARLPFIFEPVRDRRAAGSQPDARRSVPRRSATQWAGRYLSPDVDAPQFQR